MNNFFCLLDAGAANFYLIRKITLVFKKSPCTLSSCIYYHHDYYFATLSGVSAREHPRGARGSWWALDDDDDT